MSEQCIRYANYRYTWPGRDESFICVDHVGKLETVANAMGLYLQLIPIEPHDDNMRPKCSQQICKQHNE